MTEDDLTDLITKARGKFVESGQEPIDGCSMERFIARELLPQIGSQNTYEQTIADDNNRLIEREREYYCSLQWWQKLIYIFRYGRK